MRMEEPARRRGPIGSQDRFPSGPICGSAGGDASGVQNDRQWAGPTGSQW